MTKESKGSSKMQILTAVLANIPAVTYGIQIGWLSPMAPILQSATSPAPAPLSDDEVSWLAAALTLSAVPSVLVFSYVSDKFGRKLSIIILSVLSAISWTLKQWTVNPSGLITARIFAGFAAAGTFLVVPVYVKEISEDSLRGVLGSLVMCLCNIGVIVVYVSGMFLSYFWNQWIYLAICFCHIALFTMMPESPAFLVKKMDEQAAIKAISWLRGLDKDDAAVQDELKLLKEEDEYYKTTAEISLKSIATVPAFTYGIQIGWLSPMASLLKSSASPATPPLEDVHITWMAAALPLSGIIGIPFFSFASDRFGRKICIILTSLLSCISWILKLTAHNSAAFMSARIFAGLAAGGCFVVIPVYIKETVEDSWRGALASLVMTMCKVGVLFVYTLGMFLSYTMNQAVYLGIALAHVLVFFFMPESPNFLVKKGAEEKAVRTISWLRSVPSTDKIVIDEITKLKEEQRKTSENPKITITSIVHDRPSCMALRMTVILMGVQTLSGCFALMNYAADVFRRAGTVWSPNTLALFVGSLQLAGSFFTTMTIEKCGRKIPLAGSSLMVSLCMTTLATCFLLSSLTEAPGYPHWLPVVAVCVCIFAYGVGLAPVPMVIMAEVFSFEIRARMAGASMAFSFFCSSMTVLFYTPVANAIGPYVVFYTFGAVGLFGVLYTLIWVPETKGKSLEEIQECWKDKNPPPVFV